LGAFEKQQLRGEEFSDPFKEHRARPLTEHVKDYLADLRALGRDDKYVYNIDKRLARLIDSCGWKLLADITADSFCAWREKPVEWKSKKIGPETINQHFETARAFCRWCVKRKRIATNALVDVEKIDASADIRRQRRALTTDELDALLNLASM